MQMREVVAYAASRFIEVVPEIELPGHCCSALASYPHLGCECSSLHHHKQHTLIHLQIHAAQLHGVPMQLRSSHWRF